MAQVTAYVLFLALIAATSLLVVTATLVVLRSDRARTNGIVFLVGFLVGTVLACMVGLSIGDALVERLDSHETIAAVATLLIGIALVGVSLTDRRSRDRPVETSSSRAEAILAGLSHVGPAATVSMAGLLGFGGPKRLLLACLAMAAVADAGLGATQEVTIVVLYVAVATVLVSVPVVLALVGGSQAGTLLAQVETRLRQHGRALRLWVGLGLGAALIAAGLVKLIF